jgi:hypothetical protein
MAGMIYPLLTERTETEESGVRGGRWEEGGGMLLSREKIFIKKWLFLHQMLASATPQHVLSELKDVAFCL